jgi:glucose/arabinose dehydrogenase
VTSRPGDPDHLFVVEKRGLIHVLGTDGSTPPGPFLDVTALVSTGDEQGLLGLAFAPDYATSKRFYLNYTDVNGNTVIARYTVVQPGDLTANPAADAIVITIPQLDPFHNGGMIAFGPGDFLYVGMGDGNGAIGGDPAGTAQDNTDLLGSTLRLDVSGATYTSPADNPFVAVGGARPELWDLGLRNPWRFSFDRMNDDLYIGDVGQNEHEEIDVSTAANGGGKGLNYGWNVMEGTSCFVPASGCNQTGLTLPVLTYDHTGGACAVTGGYVYRGPSIPALQGTYFYADYCTGDVGSFVLNNGTATSPMSWSSLNPGGNVTSFGEDLAGEMYIVTQQGGVYRIVEQ